MPKPGQSPNIANPSRSAMQGVADAAEVGRGSKQDAATTQTASMNPNRLVPPQMPAGPSGRAEVEVNDVLDNQTSDYTSSTRTRNAQRKRLFVSNP